MRLFLAIPVAQEIRASLAEMQVRLKGADGDVRWVGGETLHLTVTFLGDLNDSLLPDIEAVCADLAAQTSAFRMRVRGGSGFPKRGPNLKTLWAGIAEGSDEWKMLATLSDRALRVFGVPRSGELVPHITLGRVKSEQNMAALREALLTESETVCGEQIADRMTLVQTLLQPSGVVYRDVRTWPFSASSDAAASDSIESNESLTLS